MPYRNPSSSSLNTSHLPEPFIHTLTAYTYTHAKHHSLLAGEAMEEQVERLVQKTWAKYKHTSRSKRVMIAVSGIPGSGTM